MRPLNNPHSRRLTANNKAMVTPVLISRNPRKEESGRSLHSGRSVSFIRDDGDYRAVYADMKETSSMNRKEREEPRKREARGRMSRKRFLVKLNSRCEPR